MVVGTDNKQRLTNIVNNAKHNEIILYADEEIIDTVNEIVLSEEDFNWLVTKLKKYII